VKIREDSWQKNTNITFATFELFCGKNKGLIPVFLLKKRFFLVFVLVLRYYRMAEFGHEGTKNYDIFFKFVPLCLGGKIRLLTSE